MRLVGETEEKLAEAEREAAGRRIHRCGFPPFSPDNNFALSF